MTNIKQMQQIWNTVQQFPMSNKQLFQTTIQRSNRNSKPNTLSIRNMPSRHRHLRLKHHHSNIMLGSSWLQIKINITKSNLRKLVTTNRIIASADRLNTNNTDLIP